MKVAVIGATGFVGSKLVDELTNRGHEVKAISRAQGIDVNDTTRLAKALKGNDVVISAFNAGWTNPNIYDDFLNGSRSIEKATELASVKRLIVIGGAGSLYLDDNKTQLVDTPNFPKEIFAGANAARNYLNEIKQNTTLDWTFFSPAIEMHQGTAGIRKGTYRTALENPVFNAEGRSILSVEDVAVAIVDEVENPQFIKKRFTAAY